jgi:hypothetical protein
MTYAIVTATTGATVVGYPFHNVIFTKTAQSDSVTVFDKAGIIPISISCLTDAASLSAATQEWWEYAVIRNNGGELSTSAAIEYDTAIIGERNSSNYYMMAPASGECIYVSKDDGSAAVSGNLTGCVRGALGSTAYDIADDDYLLVMNCIHLHSARVGKMMMTYIALPDDPKANFF